MKTYTKTVIQRFQHSPSNLADLLADEGEQTKEDKIAIARTILKQEQEALN